MRVLILTHHYPPEVGAPQTRLSGTAAFLRSRGHSVRVVTALPSYPTGMIPPRYRGRTLVRERIDGIRVYRPWTYARPGSSMRLRLANQLSFTATALLALPRVGRPDVILVESPPLFLGATGALFGRLLRAPVVLHVSDLWPAFPIQLGALRNPALVRAAELFERVVYRLSDRLVVVTDAWAAEIERQRVPPAKISVVTNGVDADVLDPAAGRDERRRVRSELSLDGKTVVICLGTVSNVYDYGLILDAAAALASRDDIRFLIVGDGSQKAAVRRQVEDRRLSNVVLLSAQPRERVRGLLAAADVSITAMQPIPFTGGQLPVRILESMAMGLPVALAGAGEARKLVEGAEAGLVVAPGNVDGVIHLITRLASDETLRGELGTAGRRMILERFSRAAVAAGIEAALVSAASSRR